MTPMMQSLMTTLGVLGFFVLLYLWNRYGIKSGTDEMMLAYFKDELAFVQKHGLKGEGSNGMAPSIDMPPEFEEWAKGYRVKFDGQEMSAWRALHHADMKYKATVQQQGQNDRIKKLTTGTRLEGLGTDTERPETLMGERPAPITT